MLPVDPDDYEKRVARAAVALDAFYSQLVTELDDQDGGITWWKGYCDWKTLTLLSDYLIQSVLGVSDALLAASFAARTHRQAIFSDGHAMKAAAREGRSPFPLDAAGRRRHLTITQSQESCFFHLGQTLDRLSAVVLIVGGIEVNNVIRADWGDLEEISQASAKASVTPKLQPVGSPGRGVQDALLAPVLNWPSAGPDEWLTWMRDTRNGMTHRAGGRKMMAVTNANQLVRLMYRQPRWSELQSLIFGARAPKKPFYDAFIPSASEDVLDGLCDSMSQLVEEITTAMVTCWKARAANPSMIVQHGKQWKEIEPAEPISAFPGYGASLPLPTSGQLRINSVDARRWTTARVMDDRRSDWY